MVLGWVGGRTDVDELTVSHVAVFRELADVGSLYRKGRWAGGWVGWIGGKGKRKRKRKRRPSFIQKEEKETSPFSHPPTHPPTHPKPYLLVRKGLAVLQQPVVNVFSPILH